MNSIYAVSPININGWMDGWMDGWMNKCGWMDGCIDQGIGIEAKMWNDSIQIHVTDASIQFQ